MPSVLAQHEHHQPLTEPAEKQKPQPGPLVKYAKNFGMMVVQGSWFGEVTGPFTIRQCINIHKLLVLPIYLLTIHFASHTGLANFDSPENVWAPSAAVLLVCHSAYGLLWCYKDVHFPDKSWQDPMNAIGFATIFLFPLGSYYTPMLCLTTDYCNSTRFGKGNELSIIMLGLWCYMVGFFFAFCSDLQKTVMMDLQKPRRLIRHAMFSHCRNPNYFGEIMIYTGYAVLSMNWLPLILFALTWVGIFLPNMLAKEASMSRHPQWQAWKERTGFMIPWIPALLKDVVGNVLTKLPQVVGLEHSA